MPVPNIRIFHQIIVETFYFLLLNLSVALNERPIN